MSAIPTHYPPTDEHYQLSSHATNMPTLVVALPFIWNLLFWLFIAVKNAGFRTLPFVALHLSNQYESILGLPTCIATWVLFFAMGIYGFALVKSLSYRVTLLICTFIFIFINFFGIMFYVFVGSKQFNVIESISTPETTYHLALMDTNSCNNPPCDIDYWYRLYQCDSTDTSCQITFESERYWRWISDPNKSAHLQRDSANNNLQVIYDGKVIFSGVLSP